MGKKPRSALDRWWNYGIRKRLNQYGEKLLREDGVLHRMLCCEASAEALREEYPVVYWLVVILMLIVLMLPMIVYSLVLEMGGHGTLFGWRTLPGVIGFFTAIFAGIGVVNLLMPVLEMLCSRLLRKNFPQGFAVPFYLGHRVTLIFLVGFGVATALCAWLVCCI